MTRCTHRDAVWTQNGQKPKGYQDPEENPRSQLRELEGGLGPVFNVMIGTLSGGLLERLWERESQQTHHGLT